MSYKYIRSIYYNFLVFYNNIIFNSLIICHLLFPVNFRNSLISYKQVIDNNYKYLILISYNQEIENKYNISLLDIGLNLYNSYFNKNEDDDNISIISEVNSDISDISVLSDLSVFSDN